MKKHTLLMLIAVVAALVPSLAAANDAVAITAEQAFDAYIDQVDPVTGASSKVVIVDIRTPDEYYWLGTCAKVDRMVLKNGEVIIPYKGKVKLSAEGDSLDFSVDEGGVVVDKNLLVAEVESMDKTAISILNPYQQYDKNTCTLYGYKGFKRNMERLAHYGQADVIIMICRSGNRSSDAVFAFNLFKAVYEVDDPDDKNAGVGGIQGSTYKNIYNGYRGFPGRNSSGQTRESVSWMDAGLPLVSESCGSYRLMFGQ